MSVQLKDKEIVPVSFQALEYIKAIQLSSGPNVLAACRDKAAYIVNKIIIWDRETKKTLEFNDILHQTDFS